MSGAPYRSFSLFILLRASSFSVVSLPHSFSFLLRGDAEVEEREGIGEWHQQPPMSTSHHLSPVRARTFGRRSIKTKILFVWSWTYKSTRPNDGVLLHLRRRWPLSVLLRCVFDFCTLVQAVPSQPMPPPLPLPSAPPLGAEFNKKAYRHRRSTFSTPSCKSYWQIALVFLLVVLGNFAVEFSRRVN